MNWLEILMMKYAAAEAGGLNPPNHVMKQLTDAELMTFHDHIVKCVQLTPYLMQQLGLEPEPIEDNFWVARVLPDLQKEQDRRRNWSVRQGV